MVAAQFPPTPEGVTTLRSKFHPGITVSYKEPGLCETTPGVKSYAGYVHLPVDALNETFEHNQYPINTFYWFFESRKDPANAPLSIWLNGGPGGSSLLGALSENGPCFIANDSKTTYLNPWSWNNEANILFIDQPNQVGYSYDILTNVTVGLDMDSVEGGSINPSDFSDGVPEQNSTSFVGTVGSQLVNNTANSTQHAAVALWHFAQTWFEEFPQYKPHDERISLFTESYGGHYGPGIMDYWLHKNKLVANGTIPEKGAHYLHLSTLGIINGCINAPDMFKAMITFAYNNTYDIHAITKEQYESTMSQFDKPGGALDAIMACRHAQKTTDPLDHGDIAKTNRICANAAEGALNITDEVFVANNLAARFDVTHEASDPFPPWYMAGWLNSADVQKALGVPVNHTWASPAVAEAFGSTGDMAKGGQLEQLAYVLNHGVNVALLHGDRDYACNWVGGEQSSLKIPWDSQQEFAEAGYAPISLSEPYTQSGGLTRQYGNLSFTRVYQAGHMVPSYQPEVAYNIFMRAITGKDIATGKVDLRGYSAAHNQEYSTSGKSDAWYMKNDVLPQPRHECYVLQPLTCNETELQWLHDGTAVVKDYILVGRNITAKVNLDRKDRWAEAGRGVGQNPLLKDW